MSSLKDELIDLGSENPNLRNDLREIIVSIDESQGWDEVSKRDIKRDLKSYIRPLHNASRSPDIWWHDNRCILKASYRDWDVHKEFDRQDRRKIKKKVKKGEEEVERFIEKYSHMIEDWSLRHGDKNYFDVHINFKACP